jgi:peroxiredoxin (alkyl hydroperoxide reductase subunit C)
MKRVVLIFTATIMLAVCVSAQTNKIPLIGSKAPEFSAVSTTGNLTFPGDFGKSWKILFSHPADFTPVCSTELLELAYLQPNFEKLGVKVAVISTDNLELHKMWIAYLEELNYKNRGKVSINFPLIDDQNGTCSRMYGMLHEPVSTNRDIRGVFIIDSDNIVRSINFYPTQIGRNMDEIIRIVQALQETDQSQVFTPVNWQDGDDVIVPYFPYTTNELALNPEIANEYYQLGNRIWFKKYNKK